MNHAKLLLKHLTLVLVFVGAAASAEADSKPAECIYVMNSVQMVRLQLPVVRLGRTPEELVFQHSPADFASQRCSARWVKAFVVESETPVLVDGTNRTLMTANGDICAASPRFVIHDAYDLRSVYQTWDVNGDLWPHPMAPRVAAAAAVSKARCGRLPLEMRFVARVVEQVDDAEWRRAAAGKIKAVLFRHRDFYASRVEVRNGYSIVSDDRQQEEAFLLRERALVDEGKRLESARAYRFALGAMLVMLAMGQGMIQCDPLITQC